MIRAFLALLLLLVLGCSQPQPVALIVFFDASASSQKYQEESQRLLRQLLYTLHPSDSVHLFRVSQSVVSIYSGQPLGKSLKPTLETYFSLDQSERGTAVGSAIERAVREAGTLQERGYRPVILLFGDMADEPVLEGGRNLTLDTLPELAEQLSSDASLISVFGKPANTDRLRGVLQPILGDRLLLLPPTIATEQGGRRLLQRAVGR